MIGVDWMPGREHAVGVGDRVLCKFDLSRKGEALWWTIEATPGAHKGKVVAHVRGAVLTDCTTKISAATQARWAGQRRKRWGGIGGTLSAAAPTADGAVVTFDFHSGNPWFLYADSGVRFDAAPVVSFKPLDDR